MGILRVPNKCCLLLQYLPRHHQLFALIFVILTQVVCGLHGVQLLQIALMNIVFYVVFSVPFSHRPSTVICLASSDADGGNKPQRLRVACNQRWPHQLAGYQGERRLLPHWESERNKSRFYASPYGFEAICLEERNWSQLIRSNEGVPQPGLFLQRRAFCG